ncbi:hypothetical protein FCULG_00012324, partial [Fusarium culmorum]
PALEEELNLPIETGDEDKEEIAPTYPDFYKDKVTKLKYNNLLNAAKFNSKVAKNKIKELKGKVSNIANLAKNLNKELYKEHIKYTVALAATRKDLREILKLY